MTSSLQKLLLFNSLPHTVVEIIDSRHSLLTSDGITRCCEGRYQGRSLVQHADEGRMLLEFPGAFLKFQGGVMQVPPRERHHLKNSDHSDAPVLSRIQRLGQRAPAFVLLLMMSRPWRPHDIRRPAPLTVFWERYVSLLADCTFHGRHELVMGKIESRSLLLSTQLRRRRPPNLRLPSDSSPLPPEKAHRADEQEVWAACRKQGSSHPPNRQTRP